MAKIQGKQLESPIILSGSFSGSFEGDGSNLTGISGGNIDTGSFATTGSNIFVGDQTITGSVTITGSSTLTNIGPAIFSGSLNVTSSFTASGLNYPPVDGIDGSVIVSDGLGNLSMGHGERLVVQVRNNESFTITAGTPLHAVGSVGGSARVLVVTASADSSNTDTMPAFGIAATDLTPTGDTKDGFAVTTGIFPDYNFTLAPGSITVEEGHVLYVGQNGGLTNVKPDTNDQNLIQNVGIVLKTNGTLVQNFQVSAINRTNDVPNLNQGNIFFGSGSNYAKIHISGALDQTALNNITASGNISASGNIFGSNITQTQIQFDVPIISGSHQHLYIGDVAENSNGLRFNINDNTGTVLLESLGSPGNVALQVEGNITASSNISASATVFGDTGSFSHISANPVDSNTFLKFDTNIIKAGETIPGLAINTFQTFNSNYSTNFNGVTRFTNVLIGSGSGGGELYIGTTAGLGYTVGVNLTGNLTASGNISASSNLSALQITGSKLAIGSPIPTAAGYNGLTSKFQGGAFFNITEESDSVFGIHDSPDGADILRIDTDPDQFLIDPINNGYKVGIGTPTPPQKLTVEGNISSSGYIRVDGDQGGLLFSNNNDKVYFDGTNIVIAIDDGDQYTFRPGGLDLQGNLTASNNISASGQIIGDVIDTSFENFLNFEAATAYTYIVPFPLTINFTGSSTSSMEEVGLVTASANTDTFSSQISIPITLGRFDKLKVTPLTAGLFTFSGSRII